MKSKVVILILAAGKASRMGTLKQLLPWGSHTLLGHVISKVQHTNIGPVFCLLGAHADQIRPTLAPFGINLLENPYWKKGLGSSLAVGIRQIAIFSADVDAVLVVLGDQPLIEEGHLRALVGKHPEHPGCIIASSYSQGPGVPVVFPSAFFERLMQLSGDTGARKLLRQWSNHVVTLEAPGQLIDIDTPEEYQQYLQAFAPAKE